MRKRRKRLALPGTLAACLFSLAPGCKRDDTARKIVGQWEVVHSAPLGMPAGVKELWGFGPDSSFTLDAEGPHGNKHYTGTYRFGRGKAHVR